MTSSYSTDLKLELMVTGENAGTWGDNTNNNLNLIQQAVAGFESLALNDGGNLALVMTDKTISTARNMVIKFTGTLTGASTVTVPDTIEKFYIFDCSAVGGPTNLTIKTASGTGFTLDAAKIYAAYTDGTNLNEISLDTLGGTIAAANITGTIATAQIADDAVTSAKIADNAIITAKISNANVTTAKIADDAVTADKLANTAVSAGSYTATNLTVDAQGRITAASSGAGAANMEIVLLQSGPVSGTYTSGPAASKFQAYLGGAGGGGGNSGGRSPGGRGGNGGFGFYSGAVASATGYSYSVGAGGGAGSTGGTATITNLATANGGNGGGAGVDQGPAGANPPGTPGTDGTAPGANTTLLSANMLFGLDQEIGEGGAAGTSGGYPIRPGSVGFPGVIAIFDDRG